MWTPETLANTLTQELGAPVQVRFTRSRGTPVRAKALGYGPFAKAGVDLALHRFFHQAPGETVQDLGHWLRVGKRARAASQRLDGWIQVQVSLLPDTTPRRIVLRPEGQVYDLRPLMESVREQEFPDHFAPPTRSEPDRTEPDLPGITWSQQNIRGRLRSLRLGSFCRERDLVRIHPVLDDVKVPEFFVRYIIFHELLHAVHPSHKGPGGRWVHHSRAFRLREAQFPDYEKALRWEQKDLWGVAKKRRRRTP